MDTTRLASTQPQVYSILHIAYMRMYFCWFFFAAESSSLGCLFWYIARPFSVCLRVWTSHRQSECVCVFVHRVSKLRACDWIESFVSFLELVVRSFSFCRPFGPACRDPKTIYVQFEVDFNASHTVRHSAASPPHDSFLSLFSFLFKCISFLCFVCVVIPVAVVVVIR